MFGMWKANQQESERKIQLAVAEIHRTVSERSEERRVGKEC